MSEIPCTLCAAPSRLDFRHPEALIYRCPVCRHRFSDPDSLPALEIYSPEYYEQKHRNWFEHPDIGLFDAVRSLILRHRPRAQKVLDIGCGRGDFLRRLAVHGDGFALQGIDFSPNPPTPGIVFRQGDFLTQPMDERFDVLTNFMVIEHVTDPPGFVRRLAEVAAPDGLIFIHTIDEASVLYAMARALRFCGIPGPFNRLYSRHHLNHFNAYSLRQLVESCGLDVIEVHRSNMPMAAVDFGSAGPMTSLLYRLGIWSAFALGRLIGATYAQTVVCTPRRMN